MATGTDVEGGGWEAAVAALVHRVAMLEVATGRATDATFDDLTADEVDAITGSTTAEREEQKKKAKK